MKFRIYFQIKQTGKVSFSEFPQRTHIRRWIKTLPRTIKPLYVVVITPRVT